MGLFISENGYYMISTYTCPPVTMLTGEGKKATVAATKIQNWWRNLMLKRIEEYLINLQSEYSYESESEIDEQYIKTNTTTTKSVEVETWLFIGAFFVSVLSTYGWYTN